MPIGYVFGLTYRNHVSDFAAFYHFAHFHIERAVTKNVADHRFSARFFLNFQNLFAVFHRGGDRLFETDIVAETHSRYRVIYMLLVLRAYESRVRYFAFRENFVRVGKAIFGFYSESFDRFFSRFRVYVGDRYEFGAFAR